MPKGKIIDYGYGYYSYERMANKYNLKNWDRSKLDNGDVVEIIDTVPHLLRDNPVCIVRKDDQDFLIGESGVEVLSVLSKIEDNYEV